MCVLGAINARYGALCDVRLYVCMCLELSANYSQTVRVFVFFHETEWLSKVLRILNLEEQLNCRIGSKVTAILSCFFSRKFESSNVGMWGVYPEAKYLYIALCTHI